MGTAAGSRGIAVERSGEVGLLVLGSERQLATAVGNLLDNAVNYSPDGAPVLVSTRSDRGVVEVNVIDQGIGIGPADAERVFERFYRADPARARATGGTGLGLAIVKHVASNHGGSVEVRSTEGHGSTFTLRLPAVDGTSAMTRVLIVEDEESISEPLAYMLASEGFEVSVAATGPAGLEAFDRDGRRPRAARPDAARACRAPRCAASCATRSSVPVIMLTARDSEIDKVVGLELGADDYVTKPFSHRELVARIRAVLRRRAASEPTADRRPRGRARSGWTSTGTS